MDVGQIIGIVIGGIGILGFLVIGTVGCFSSGEEKLSFPTTGVFFSGSAPTTGHSYSSNSTDLPIFGGM